MPQAYEMSSHQKQKWLQGMKELRTVTAEMQALLRKAAALRKGVLWFQGETGALPPSWKQNADLTYSIERRGNNLEKQLDALNYAYQLVKGGAAYVQVSTDYPDDFDIVTNQSPGSPIIERAMFRRGEPMGLLPAIVPFIPLLIKAGAVIITAALAYGIVDAIADAHTESKMLDRDIVKMQNAVEQDMARDPSLFDKWSKYRKSVGINNSDWFSSFKNGLAGVGGGAVALIGLALLGFMLFKSMDKKGERNERRYLQ